MAVTKSPAACVLDAWTINVSERVVRALSQVPYSAPIKAPKGIVLQLQERDMRSQIRCLSVMVAVTAAVSSVVASVAAVATVAAVSAVTAVVASAVAVATMHSVASVAATVTTVAASVTVRSISVTMVGCSEDHCDHKDQAQDENLMVVMCFGVFDFIS